MGGFFWKERKNWGQKEGGGNCRINVLSHYLHPVFFPGPYSRLYRPAIIPDGPNILIDPNKVVTNVLYKIQQK